MQLQIADIKKHGAELQIEQSADHYPILAQLAQQEGVVFSTPVRVQISAQVVGGVVELEGSVQVEVQIPCSRCLEPSCYPLEGHFHLSYVEQLPNVTGEDGEELELTAEEMGLEVFDGEILDLEDEIQQQVVLLLPSHPLCDDDCRGLCTGCGVDLNREACRCTEKKVSMHFVALKDFKVEK